VKISYCILYNYELSINNLIELSQRGAAIDDRRRKKPKKSAFIPPKKYQRASEISKDMKDALRVNIASSPSLFYKFTNYNTNYDITFSEIYSGT
jgi:hypothetical protein